MYRSDAVHTTVANNVVVDISTINPNGKLVAVGGSCLKDFAYTCVVGKDLEHVAIFCTIIYVIGVAKSHKCATGT